MGAAGRKSPPCSDELTGVPELLRFVEVAQNESGGVGCEGCQEALKKRHSPHLITWQKLRGKCISQQGCETPHLPGVGQEGRSFLLEGSVSWR